MTPNSQQLTADSRTAHLPMLIVLLIGIAVTIYIGATGQFKFFNEKGLLSGPFSALLLIGAVESAGFLMVLLDWRVWRPRALKRTREIERWLNADLLGNAQPPPENWETLRGQFRAHEVTLQREATRRRIGVWRWSVATRFPGSFSAVRSTKPVKAGGATELATGDSDFEERYAWQSDRPTDLTALLRQPEARSAIKRLASLMTLHGAIADSNCGVRVSQKEVTIRQIPAPALSRPGFNPDELLLVLHDLTLLASMLEGAPAPATEVPQASSQSGASWLALGCAALVGLALWLGLTFLVARYVGLPAAMVAFFLPAVALAFWFILLSARGSGREGELDAAIDREAGAQIEVHPDLRQLKERLCVEN